MVRNETLLARQLAGSWMQTCQKVMGTRAHKPSFVVFEIGQSGCMTTLSNWLAHHEKITFQADILSRRVRFPRVSVYQHVRQSAAEVYGFTVVLQQLRQVQQLSNPNQFFHDLHRGGCRIVYLHRRDMLRQAIAILKAHSLNSRPDAPRLGKFVVDVSELLACLQYLDSQRLEAIAALHEVPHLKLTYEDDLIDPNAHANTAKRLSDFLSIADIRPGDRTLKLVHQHLADIVANYAELCAGLAVSEYAYLLSDSCH